MAKRTVGWVLLVGVVAAGIAILDRAPDAPPLLAQRTGVVALAPAPRGLQWPSADAYPDVAAAVEGTDPDSLRAALESAELGGVWVGLSPNEPWGPERPLRERFAAAGVVRGFVAEYIGPQGVLFVVDPTEWPEGLAQEVLARAARQILEGGDPPPLDAFPEPLKTAQSVEVVVLLRGPTGPRLWRSARSQSIAEGLNTAALAARERWDERSATMGGPLEESLDELDVEVALLFDDGTLDVHSPAVIDAVVKPVHGAAYEQPTRWRYLLPAATHAGRTPSDAYRALFADNGMAEESFERSDLRLYRMRMKTLSIDYGSAGSRRAGVPSGSDGSPDAASPASPSSAAASDSNAASGSSAGSKTTNVVPNP